MSTVSWWALGVRGRSLDEVVASMRAWPPAEGKVEACPPAATLGAHAACKRELPAWVFFAAREISGWTILHFLQQRHIAELVQHLSRALATRVLSVDCDEGWDFEHFAQLDAGEVVISFTNNAEDPGEDEQVGVDPAEIFAWVKASGRWVIPRDAEPIEYVFTVLQHRRADIDLEKLLFADPGYRAAEAPHHRLYAPDFTGVGAPRAGGARRRA
jgi:hypothetical protein